MSTNLDRAIAAIQDRSSGGWAIEAAQAWAAIAQAEQLKRMADAAERQAAAVEKRNELLEFHNEMMAENIGLTEAARQQFLAAIEASDE